MTDEPPLLSFAATVVSAFDHTSAMNGNTTAVDVAVVVAAVV